MTTSRPLIVRCFNLAWFLFPHKETALRIAEFALRDFETSLNRQDRRIKYLGKIRTKVLLNDVELVQRLLFESSTRLEKEHEKDGYPWPVRFEDLLVRWFKTAISAAMNNSFYTTVAHCRILHRYSTSDARSLYEFLLQDPARGKDDDQYRRAKKHFIGLMQRRFDGKVALVTLDRGETHFRALADFKAMAGLAKDCQSKFAPWDAVPVAIPPHFEPGRHELSALKFEGKHVDDEAEVEARRRATVLQPESFCEVARVLRLGNAHQFETPFHYLIIPEFTMTPKDVPPDGSNSTADDRDTPPALDERDVRRVGHYLERHAATRAALRPEKFSLDVDDSERLVLEASSRGAVSFRIGEFDRMIRIYGSNCSERVLLGSFLIVRDASGDPSPGVFGMDGAGWNLTLLLNPDCPVEATLTYGMPSSLLETVLEKIAAAMRTSGGSGLAPSAAYRLRISRSPSDRVTRVCPCCGGLLMESAPINPSQAWLIRKCDRCPYVMARQE
jgi:hypothetical protein